MNRRVFALGETLLDIIFEGHNPVKAVPGGSMLNAAVSLGRTGIPVELISEFGDDPVGKIVQEFLSANYVSFLWSTIYSSNKTSIALAILDPARNANYSFYHDTPEYLNNFAPPDFSENDILVFGSYYSIKPSRLSYIRTFTDKASTNGSILLYDPNIRAGHHVHMADFMESVIENMRTASILKGSDDDFQTLYGTKDPEQLYQKTRELCPFLIITRGAKDLVMCSPSFISSFHVPALQPISTIGAGDNFNAGVVYGLIKQGIRLKDLTDLKHEVWKTIIEYGIAFAGAACISIENYVPQGFDASKLFIKQE